MITILFCSNQRKSTDPLKQLIVHKTFCFKLHSSADLLCAQFLNFNHKWTGNKSDCRERSNSGENTIQQKYDNSSLFYVGTKNEQANQATNIRDISSHIDERHHNRLESMQMKQKTENIAALQPLAID